jgi:hypothetical protein
MTLKRIGLAVVLAAFLALSAYAVYQHGVLGLFQLVLANSATTLAFVDLVIALSMVMVWMWGDARRRGVSPMPYVLVTLALGSAGPLLYLLTRDEETGAVTLGPKAVASPAR